MKKENILFLSLAIFTVICIMAIGVAISEKSIFIAIGAIIGVIASFGFGFSYRKKLRNTEMQ